MLEQKIEEMNSQILIGGRKIEDLPQFQSALKQQQQKIRQEFKQEYESKLNAIEKEREQIEAE